MNVKNLVLGIGIFVVYLLMLNYGIEAFYPSPHYDQYCTGGEFSGRYPVKPYGDYYGSGGNCTFSRVIQEQSDQCSMQQGQPIYTYNDAGCTTGIKECNFCTKEFNEANQAHAKVVFVIALIAGILTLLIGFGILSVEPVGSALMASGVGAIFYGSMRNWENLSDIWRFLLLVAALVLLIWIALHTNKPHSRFEKFKFWK